MDPSKATCYTQVKEWQGDHGAYTNLIYRVHFEESASDSKSIGINAGKNTGLLLIITLNADKKPVLMNAVHTCGCFHALFPTNYLDASLYPEDWDRDKQKVYGETPPGFVSFPETGDAHPVFFLRGGSHRVTDVNAASIETLRTRFELLPMTLAPMDALKHLPLGDGETSFYYESGRKKGLVKGAGKSGESVLFGAWMGDANVGQDREYGSKDETGRLFYTTLNRMDKDSDMSGLQGIPGIERMENVSSMFPYGDLDAGETVEDRLTGPGASIRSLKRKTELLAPAGKWEALEAVLEAGADAVYLSGKRFQMRAHRKDFNFDDEALARAVTYAHERNKRVYVTVNALLAEHELEDCRSFLVLLQEAGADGAIVCDLAVLALARELGVTYELHGSTMMNIHEAGQARVLKRLGLHRAVTSRDIGIAAAGRLGDESGLAVEYFLHATCSGPVNACS